MRETPVFGTAALMGFVVVMALAIAARAGYLVTCCDGGAAKPSLIVQGQGPRLDFDVETQLGLHGPMGPTQFDNLVFNLREHRWFGSLAPLADKEEQTAHVAPGYYWLASLVPSETLLRRIQAGVGTLTVLCLFFFARLAFASNIAATIVGLLAALHPFWIVNAGELADGTLITFLLTASLMMGTIAARTGGPLSSALFGLSLAGLTLVRAALLPFSFLALGWFLLRCRGLRLGWFAGLLAILGFGNGLAPWLVRNQSVFHEIIPIADSAYLHLWMGSCPKATGGTLNEKELRESLPPARVQELIAEPNQAKRYNQLGRDVVQQIKEDPAAALRLRFSAAACFLAGESFAEKGTLVATRSDGAELPSVVRAWAPFTHLAALAVLFVLAALGWRLSEPCAADSRLATLAFLCIPLPYLLSHAESLSGPRLPWDVPLIVFAGFAVTWLLPSVQRQEPSMPQTKQAIQEAATRRL
jgi:hypothetical protein